MGVYNHRLHQRSRRAPAPQLATLQRLNWRQSVHRLEERSFFFFFFKFIHILKATSIGQHSEGTVKPNETENAKWSRGTTARNKRRPIGPNQELGRNRTLTEPQGYQKRGHKKAAHQLLRIEPHPRRCGARGGLGR